LIRKAFSLLALLLFAGVTQAASAQTTPPPTTLQRQLRKFEFSFQGAGIYNSNVTGNVISGFGATDQGLSLTEHPSNTFGMVMSIDFPATPYFGVQFNYGYSRYDENFEGPAVANFDATQNIGATPTTDYPVQTDVEEYTLGYLVEIPYTIDGLQPIFSAGFGPMAFKPTPLGGEEQQEKARMTYYYSMSFQKDFSHKFGVDFGFRQLFFLAPDFGQNYFLILKHTTTYEPTAGFYFRY
jgi:hypothetical protein